MTVAGKNKIELKDILVGEVWLCSGQSNMEMGIQNVKDGAKEVAEANHPHLRLFSVPRHVADQPQENLLMPKPGAKPAATDEEGKWLLCTPENVIVGQWGGFSACGYFFGRDLHKDLKVPVGLIHSSWGGTVAEAWTQRQHLEGEPDFATILQSKDNARANYEKALANYQAELARAKAAAAANQAQKNAQPGDKPPVIRRIPRQPLRAPQDPANNPNQASVLYNGMIQPIVPFAIKGAIWYQGESNANRAYQYRKLLPAMIKSWRDVWNEPEMDFYIVSLANFTAPATTPGDDDWAELREAQAMTAALPHNGEALAIDLADADKPGDIHPKNKQEVGRRLELVALAKTYGKPVAYSGPVYKDFKIEGNKVILHFTFAEGLTAKGGEPLKGFQIAGQDKKWFWADAKIEGDTVIVSSKEVEKPAAVRYDWAHNPQGNLYNKADLPTTPFRTDDWQRPVAPPKGK
jgi:sialate O-acetylesterase